MISNINTYLFFSAMAFGAAMALLLRVLVSKKRGMMWDAFSSSFLINIIIALSLLPLGLVFSQWDGSHLFPSVIFYVSNFIVFTFLFYFFKALTVPIVFVFLISTYFLFHFFLSDYKLFSTEEALSFRVLKVGEDYLEVEISSAGEKSHFVTIGKDAIYPEIIRLDLSPYLFVLPGAYYFKVVGLTDLQGISGQPDDSLSMPSFLYSLSYVEVPPLGKEILDAVEIKFSDDGEITSFLTE